MKVGHGRVVVAVLCGALASMLLATSATVVGATEYIYDGLT